MPTATSVWTSRAPPLARDAASSSGLDHGLVAEQEEFDVGMPDQSEIPRPAPPRSPWSPPMASSAMRTLSGMERAWRFRRVGCEESAQRRDHNGWDEPDKVRRSRRRSALHPRAPGAFSAPPAPQMDGRIVVRFRRFECRAGFARIRIDAEDQEFGGDGAEIDRPSTSAARQHLRDRRLGLIPLGAARLGRARKKTRSTGSSISVVIGSSVTTQVCPTAAVTSPRCRPLDRPRDSKLACKRGTPPRPRAARCRRAPCSSAIKFEMQPALGHAR